MTRAPDAARIALTLISHTNAGKTTLARTLLDRDIGVVRDAAHVTREASVHTLVETDAGDMLALWDTPGFGDSARLARRLAQQKSPIGWFLAQVWDRYRDPTLWLTQVAVRNVRDEADVVLYLVNAAEAPQDAGWLAPELDVLAWIGKPVVVLLNQTGPVGDTAAEEADSARWRVRLAAAGHADVLPLDAFARCWVQELALFATLERVVAAGKRAACARLARAWTARRRAQFDAALAAMAATLAQAARDRETLPADPLLAKVGRSLGIARNAGESAQGAAERAMVARVEAALRVLTDALIDVHRLAGTAAAEAFARTGGGVRRDAPIDEGKAAMMGGVVTGALSGLAADIAAGGLTLGGGMIAGALLGALGGAGVARGMNVARDRTTITLSFDEAFLRALAEAVILRYLAVAHFGRGRGEWRADAPPASWQDAVRGAYDARGDAWASLWSRRDAADFDASLDALLGRTTETALAALYPDATLPPAVSR